MPKFPRKEPPPRLVPYACFACQVAPGRPEDPETPERVCPTCGGPALLMDVLFQPPKKSDDKQWAKVRFLAENGFFFQKIFRREGLGWIPVKYPKTLEEARPFVEEFRAQALERRLPAT